MPDNSDYFDFEEDIHDFDEEGFEARVWNLLVLINPGDEELALQQFNRWREHLSEDGQPLEADSDWLAGAVHRHCLAVRFRCGAG